MPTTPPPSPIQPLAAIAAIALPGLGHVIRGETRRGLLIALGVIGLFAGGVLIGGIDSIDSREDRIWFLGQALVGPLAFGVDYLHQSSFKGVPEEDFLRGMIHRTRSAAPDESREIRDFVRTDGSGRRIDAIKVPVLVRGAAGAGPPSSKSLSKVNELGTLFSTIAGMLNLIVIIDAAAPTRRREGEEAAA